MSHNLLLSALVTSSPNTSYKAYSLFIVGVLVLLFIFSLVKVKKR